MNNDKASRLLIPHAHGFHLCASKGSWLVLNPQSSFANRLGYCKLLPLPTWFWSKDLLTAILLSSFSNNSIPPGCLSSPPPQKSLIDSVDTNENYENGLNTESMEISLIILGRTLCYFKNQLKSIVKELFFITFKFYFTTQILLAIVRCGQ